MLLYPVIATQRNNVLQAEASAEYARLQKDVKPDILNKELEAARAYNETVGGGPILDPWLARIQPDNTAYGEYLEQLNTLPAMGRILVPTAHVDLPILHGTAETTLSRGIGHLFGSDLPVGGEGSHAVLTGHTGLTNATLFDELINVKKGDDILMVVSGEALRYVVTDVETVLPDQADSLSPVAGKDMVTLITCTPYGINSHRLLVHAERAPLEERHEKLFEEKHELRWQPWMLTIITGVGVGLLLLLVWVIVMVRKRKRLLNNANQRVNQNAEGDK